MNPSPSKSIRPGLPVRLHAAFAASLSRACPRLLALAALCLFATPGVSRADTVTDWYPDGTVNWSTDRTVTRYFQVGTYASSPNQWCVLNQTAGTITATGQTIIGQAAYGPSAYNMSGSAVFNCGTQNLCVGNVISVGTTSNTWSLTDNATATIGLLSFNISNGYLLLAGAATVSATDLTISGANYISFASGSTATLTVTGKTYDYYKGLIEDGLIRVGEATATMSQFQVVGNMLSLSTGGPPPPHLVITDVNGGSDVIAGSDFSVTVEAQDENNDPATLAEDTEVTLTLKTGTGTLGGTMSGTISNGTSSVTISGVTYTKAESGVVLEASGSGLAAGESAAFTVVPGAPFQLAFGVQPNDTDPEVAITPAVTVLVQDANGNTVPGDTRTVTISSSSTAFTIGSVLTMDAVDSVATFAAIEPTTEGTHTLTASDGSLTEATSNPFTVRSQIPDSVEDWYVDGTVNRSVDRTVTRYLQVGTYASSPSHWGVLNQTAGTITVPNNGIIIGQAADAPSAWYMSGSAALTGGQDLFVGNAGGANGHIWSLTDSATATIGTLRFHNSDGKLLLNGGASVSATDLDWGSGTGNYVSFASGSAATLTVSGLLQAGYEALVTDGNIRVDGVVQTDFSAFQVTDNTLSLAVTGTTPSTTTLANNTNITPSTYGDLLSFDVTVSGGSATPTGYVFLKDGGSSGTTLGSAILTDGACTITTTTLAAGTHDNIVAVYRGDSTYATSTSDPLIPEQVVNLPSSTVTVTGLTSFTYNGTPQGPNTADTTGSTGAVTYSYVGVDPTAYWPDSIPPTAIGTYSCTATLAADANYAGAVSAPYPFEIVAGSGGHYASWATANGFDPAHPEAVGADGLTNLLIYALDLKTDGTNGSPGTLTGNVLGFTKRADAVTNNDVTYAILISTTLAADSWTEVSAYVENSSTTISCNLPTDVGGKVFARLVVTQTP